MKKLSKKLAFILLATALIFGSALIGIKCVDLPQTAIVADAATPYTSGYYTYTVDSEGNATITAVDTAISGDVVIPSELDGYTVTKTGEKAFDSCVNITSVTIPEGLKSLGKSTFNGCSGLKTVNYNAVDCSIRYSNYGYDYYYTPFTECSEIKVVNIGEKVEKLYGSLFDDSGIQIVNYNAVSAETIKSSYSDFEYESPFVICNSICEVNFGENVEYIPAFLFEDCTGITEITIPENVTSIGSDAFRGCYNISTLNFNAINCTSVGGSFSYTVDEYDRILSPILKTINIGNKVKNIPAYAFNVCSQVTDVALPESVETIGKCAFSHCAGITRLEIPKNVSFIGDQAFSYCESLETVKINAVNAKIEKVDYTSKSYIFVGCSELKNVTIGKDVKAIPSTKELGDDTYYIGTIFYGYKKITSLNFEAQFCEETAYCFDGCSNLAEINIGPGVEKLHKYTFEGTAYYEDEKNWTIEKLTPEEGWGIKNKTLYIDNCLVAVETAVLDFSISEGTRLIADEAVSGKKCSSVTIPDSVKFIGERAFWCCNSVKEISLSDNVERIDYLAFGNMRALESITVDPDNKYYSSDEFGVLFNKDKTELIQYPVGNKRQVYYVPDGVIKVCDYAFCAPLSGSSKGQVLTEGGNLVVIVLADSVESLGEYILHYNNSLVTFYIGENSQLKSIGAHAFDYCRALENIILPDSIETIGDLAFSWCTALKKDLHIHSGDVTIGEEILLDAKRIEIDYEENKMHSIQAGICSDKENCDAKVYADENNYPFTLCESDHELNLEALLPDGLIGGPTEPTTKPAEPTTQPTEPSTTKPVEEPTTQPSTVQPTEPATQPSAQPTTKPTESVIVPTTQKPGTSAVAVSIKMKTASQSTINYGDSIILHAEVKNLPESAEVVWSTNNDNFRIVSTSADGISCTVTPQASGDTVFTATVVDKDGNEIGSDTQTMTAKAGIWQKIVAFFKKLFGLTKVIPELIKF